MSEIKQYPQSPKEIELNKIVWEFWQCSTSYNINNEFICLFSCNTKAVNDNGDVVNELGSMTIINKAFGTFSLYKIFKISNGKYVIDKGRPLKVISISSDDKSKNLDEFKQLGIFECLNSYLTSNKN
jgi:hypothetical protein